MESFNIKNSPGQHVYSGFALKGSVRSAPPVFFLFEPVIISQVENKRGASFALHDLIFSRPNWNYI